MKINNYNVDVKVKNNKMKWTLLSVHGINSSMEFTHDLDSLDNNFNHIKISMPIVGDITIEELNQIVETVIEEHVKTKDLIILGHSLGGIQVAFNHHHEKVKKVIFVAPFNPSIYKTTNVMLANSVLKGSKLGGMIKGKVEKWFPNEARLLNIVLDDKKPYINIMKEKLFNKEFIIELDNRYKGNEKDTLYLIGSKDKVINSKDFDGYVTSIGGKLNFVKGGHNPFKDDMEATHKLLNDFIEREKRFFKRRIFKK